MVLVILNSIEFEAERFETRTMPTPDFKSKEVIYWIRVNTTEKRLVIELQRFLESPSEFIELHVPSAFVGVKTELESYRPSAKITSGERRKRNQSSPPEVMGKAMDLEDEHSGNREVSEQAVEERFLLEIILRRVLPESSLSQTHSPYG